MSDGGQKDSVIPAKSLPPNALVGGRNPVSFEAKTLGPRLRGDDKIVVIVN